MDKQFNVEDESGDRKFFTIVPNYIANHSTANEQALYFQMKRMAGDNGECYYSHRTLLKKLGIGRKALNKSINYLLEHKWISEKGFRLVNTKGGEQMIRVYTVNDIWKLNNLEYSQGASKRTPLSKRCVPKEAKVRPEVSKGASERAPIKNPDQEPITKRAFSKEKAELIEKYRPKFLDKMIIH